MLSMSQKSKKVADEEIIPIRLSDYDDYLIESSHLPKDEWSFLKDGAETIASLQKVGAVFVIRSHTTKSVVVDPDIHAETLMLEAQAGPVRMNGRLAIAKKFSLKGIWFEFMNPVHCAGETSFDLTVNHESHGVFTTALFQTQRLQLKGAPLQKGSLTLAGIHAIFLSEYGDYLLQAAHVDSEGVKALQHGAETVGMITRKGLHLIIHSLTAMPVVCAPDLCLDHLTLHAQGPFRTDGSLKIAKELSFIGSKFEVLGPVSSQGLTHLDLTFFLSGQFFISEDILFQLKDLKVKENYFLKQNTVLRKVTRVFESVDGVYELDLSIVRVPGLYVFQSYDETIALVIKHENSLTIQGCTTTSFIIKGALNLDSITVQSKGMVNFEDAVQVDSINISCHSVHIQNSFRCNKCIELDLQGDFCIAVSANFYARRVISKEIRYLEFRGPAVILECEFAKVLSCLINADVRLARIHYFKFSVFEHRSGQFLCGEEHSSNLQGDRYVMNDGEVIFKHCTLALNQFFRVEEDAQLQAISSVIVVQDYVALQGIVHLTQVECAFNRFEATKGELHLQDVKLLPLHPVSLPTIRIMVGGSWRVVIMRGKDIWIDHFFETFNSVHLIAKRSCDVKLARTHVCDSSIVTKRLAMTGPEKTSADVSVFKNTEIIFLSIALVGRFKFIHSSKLLQGTFNADVFKPYEGAHEYSQNIDEASVEFEDDSVFQTRDQIYQCKGGHLSVSQKSKLSTDRTLCDLGGVDVAQDSSLVARDLLAMGDHLNAQTGSRVRVENFASISAKLMTIQQESIFAAKDLFLDGLAMVAAKWVDTETTDADGLKKKEQTVNGGLHISHDLVTTARSTLNVKTALIQAGSTVLGGRTQMDHAIMQAQSLSVHASLAQTNHSMLKVEGAMYVARSGEHTLHESVAKAVQFTAQGALNYTGSSLEVDELLETTHTARTHLIGSALKAQSMDLRGAVDASSYVADKTEHTSSLEATKDMTFRTDLTISGTSLCVEADSLLNQSRKVSLTDTFRATGGSFENDGAIYAGELVKLGFDREVHLDVGSSLGSGNDMQVSTVLMTNVGAHISTRGHYAESTLMSVGAGLKTTASSSVNTLINIDFSVNLPNIPNKKLFSSWRYWLGVARSLVSMLVPTIGKISAIIGAAEGLLQLSKQLVAIGSVENFKKLRRYEQIELLVSIKSAAVATANAYSAVKGLAGDVKKKNAKRNEEKAKATQPAETDHAEQIETEHKETDLVSLDPVQKKTFKEFMKDVTVWDVVKVASVFAGTHTTDSLVSLSGGMSVLPNVHHMSLFHANTGVQVVSGVYTVTALGIANVMPVYASSISVSSLWFANRNLMAARDLTVRARRLDNRSGRLRGVKGTDIEFRRADNSRGEIKADAAFRLYGDAFENKAGTVIATTAKGQSRIDVNLRLVKQGGIFKLANGQVRIEILERSQDSTTSVERVEYSGYFNEVAQQQSLARLKTAILKNDLSCLSDEEREGYQQLQQLDIHVLDIPNLLSMHAATSRVNIRGEGGELLSHEVTYHMNGGEFLIPESARVHYSGLNRILNAAQYHHAGCVAYSGDVVIQATAYNETPTRIIQRAAATDSYQVTALSAQAYDDPGLVFTAGELKIYVASAAAAQSLLANAERHRAISLQVVSDVEIGSVSECRDDCAVSIQAPRLDYQDASSRQHDLSLTQTEGDLNLRVGFSAPIYKLNASQGGVINHGQRIMASVYGEVNAQTDIDNRCRMDSQGQIIPGLFAGGVGLPTESDEGPVGLCLTAKEGSIKGEASHFIAVGNVRFNEKKNGQFAVVTTPYQTPEKTVAKTWSGLVSRTKMKESGDHVHSCVIQSLQGGFYHRSEEGGAHFEAVIFDAPQGRHFEFGPRGVYLDPHRTTVTQTTQTRYFFGCFGKGAQKSTYTYSQMCQIGNNQSVTLTSHDNGSADFSGASGRVGLFKPALGKGDLIIRGQVNVHDEQGGGFRLSGFLASPQATQFLISLAKNNARKALHSLIPSASDVARLSHSQHILEILAHASNVGLELANVVNGIARGLARGELDKEILAGLGLCDEKGMTLCAGVSWVYYKNSRHTETLAEEGIVCEEFEPQARALRLENGADLFAGKANLEGLIRVHQDAAFLRSSSGDDQLSIGVSADTHQALGLSIDDQHRHYSRCTPKNARFIVREHLNMGELALLRQMGGEIVCKTIAGRVQKHEARSYQETRSEDDSQVNVGFSLAGPNIGWARGSGSGRITNERSGIHVINGINHNGVDTFSIGSAHWHAAGVTTDGENHLILDRQPELTANKDFYCYESTGFNISPLALLNFLANPFRSSSSNHAGQAAIPSVPFSKKYMQHRSTSQAGCFGAQGTFVRVGQEPQANIHLQTMDGRVVHENKNMDLLWKVPLVSRHGLDQFTENMRGARESFSLHRASTVKKYEQALKKLIIIHRHCLAEAEKKAKRDASHALKDELNLPAQIFNSLSQLAAIVSGKVLKISVKLSKPVLKYYLHHALHVNEHNRVLAMGLKHVAIPGMVALCNYLASKDETTWGKVKDMIVGTPYDLVVWSNLALFVGFPLTFKCMLAGAVVYVLNDVSHNHERVANLSRQISDSSAIPVTDKIKLWTEFLLWSSFDKAATGFDILTQGPKHFMRAFVDHCEQALTQITPESRAYARQLLVEQLQQGLPAPFNKPLNFRELAREVNCLGDALLEGWNRVLCPPSYAKRQGFFQPVSQLLLENSPSRVRRRHTFGV